jgi:hypothetical protein
MRNMFEYASSFEQVLCWALSPGAQTLGMFRGSNGRLSDHCPTAAPTVGTGGSGGGGGSGGSG